ncbi:MAG: AmmeMemoRadiSam system protein B, partial [Kiritimatiellae bacterium]|nr:AmmeMemoRadiSam system protein B [Kiritimatiellia bacterium]
MKTLESTLAGAWYPGTEKAIRGMAAKWESAIGADEPAAPEGADVLVLPHAGWPYSGAVAWRAVRAVRGRPFKRAVVLAPSHRAWIENRLVAPAADAVSTPLGAISVDRDWIDRLALAAPVARDDRVHAAEHAAQIEFPILQLALAPGFSVVPLVAGSFGEEQLAMCARALSSLMDGETLLVVSSDFTHYGDDFDYAPYGTRGGADVRARAAAVDSEAVARIAARDADGFRD